MSCKPEYSTFVATKMILVAAPANDIELSFPMVHRTANCSREMASLLRPWHRVIIPSFFLFFLKASLLLRPRSLGV